MKGDQDGHDLAETELAGPGALVTPAGNEMALPGGQKNLTEIIDITKYFQ
jgi:hypothetical protein